MTRGGGRQICAKGWHRIKRARRNQRRRLHRERGELLRLWTWRWGITAALWMARQVFAQKRDSSRVLA